MSEEIEVFLSKVNAFAAGLNQNEQAMLAYLMQDDDADEDVVGFNLFECWPSSVHDIAPVKVESLKTDFGGFLSSGHATGSNARIIHMDEGETI